MFNDGNGWGVKFGNKFKCRVSVVDVVVRQRLTLWLAGRCDARPARVGLI